MGAHRLRRSVTDEEVDRFWRDGVVHLPALLDQSEVAALEDPIETLLARPDALADMSAMAEAFGEANTPAGFASGVDHWLDDPAFAAFAADGSLPALAARLLRSARVYLYEDSVLVKEPGAVEATMLHQDLAYFHVEGEQICTMWIPLDPVGRDAGAVHYLSGSHRDGRLYRPNYFVSDQPLPETEGEVVPAIDADDLVWFATVPGDVVVHHARTLHGASPNASSGRRRAVSVRYCGEDTRYRMRPGVPRKPHHRDELDGRPLDHPRCPQVWPR